MASTRHHDVCEVHPGRFHSNQYLARLRTWIGNIAQLQHFRATVLGDNNSFHNAYVGTTYEASAFANVP